MRKKAAKKKRNRTVIKAKRVLVLPNSRKKVAKKSKRNGLIHSRQLCTRNRLTGNVQCRDVNPSRKRRKNSATSTAKKVVKKVVRAAGGAISGAVKGAKKALAKNPSYTVDAIPKTQALRKTVSALTRGSAVRKVRRQVVGPKQAYNFRVMKNPKRAVKRKRRNGDIEDRIEFAGRYTKDSDLYFPQGTPGGLSKLGKLQMIETDTNKLTFQNGVWLCRDAKGRMHIGTLKKGAILIDGPARSLGRVERIDYQEAKPHLGKKYARQIPWKHMMGEENGIKPTLYADGKGGLRFKGGDYQITSGGIVN